MKNADECVKVIEETIFDLKMTEVEIDDESGLYS